MITTFRKDKSSSLARLLPWRKSNSKSNPPPILSEDQFQFELEKERSRVERRVDTAQFALLLLSIPDADVAKELVQRLRITDSLGWCGNRLGVLLPETDRKGARFVADELNEIGRKHNLDFEPKILMYPEDDVIASRSIELAEKFYDDDDWKCDGGQSLNSEDSTEVFQCSSDEHVEKLGTVDASAFSTSLDTPVWKRAIDIFGSSIGLILLSPVFLITSIAVWMSSPGPIFFRQLREGKDGKKFHIYKFRTMCNDAESLKSALRHQSEQDGPAFKLAEDPRLTTVGKYLRKSCVDELPQLLNVLKGDMSLVGPRPLPVDESIECQVWQRRRLQVLPGITCIWQVQGDRTTKFSDWMRMDMEYLRKRSFLFDLKLIVKTVLAVVLHRGSV